MCSVVKSNLCQQKKLLLNMSQNPDFHRNSSSLLFQNEVLLKVARVFLVTSDHIKMNPVKPFHEKV